MKRASVLPRAYSQDEEASAVVVIVGQAPPPLEDIISGVSTEKPFDMESLMTFAERRLFSEGIVFLTEVRENRRSFQALLWTRPHRTLPEC